MITRYSAPRISVESVSRCQPTGADCLKEAQASAEMPASDSPWKVPTLLRELYPSSLTNWINLKLCKMGQLTEWMFRNAGITKEGLCKLQWLQRRTKKTPNIWSIVLLSCRGKSWRLISSKTSSSTANLTKKAKARLSTLWLWLRTVMLSEEAPQWL